MKIPHKVQKIQAEATLAKFKDSQAKAEHYEAYNKETDRAKKIKMLAKAVEEGWI